MLKTVALPMSKNNTFIVILGFLTVSFILNKVSIKAPQHFPKPLYNFNQSPLDSAKIEIGRALFYDPILSKNGTISCASCHSPYNGFAHTDHALSHGINDSIGTRNAPALFNLAWQETFMWDGAINNIEVQALAPINHSGEMGESTKNVIKKLNKSPLYRKLFLDGFGTTQITGQLMLKAIAQFQLSLISANAKYDDMKLGKVSFTEQEKKGYTLFKQHCNACHTEPLFSTYEYKNNGLPIDSTLNDYGRGSISGKKQDSLSFKVPSLRNLSYTFPYMHDGRFDKLQDVLTHYTNGIKDSPSLSRELSPSLSLTSNEKIDLIVFLKTLDDKSFIFNRKNKFPRDILLPKEGNN